MIIDFNDVNQDIIFVSAFRYCLGRQTYVVSTMVDEMIKNWSNTPIERRRFFKKEIGEAIDKGYAGSVLIDVPEWEKILKLPNEGSIEDDPYVRRLKVFDKEKGLSVRERGILEASLKKHAKALKELSKK